MLDLMESLPDYVIGFEPWEVDEVVNDYVCPVCYGQLTAFDVPNDRIYIIACPEHGNVETIGRIRREYVSNEMARQRSQFNNVIRNLPEFWGELIPPKKPEKQNLKELGF